MIFFNIEHKTMTFYKASISLLIVTFFFQPVYAEENSVGQLENFLAQVKTLSAEFKQEVIDEQGNVAQVSKGDFYIQKPGKFRWNYQKPFTQEIVANHGRVWFYDADLEQVTIKKMDTSVGATPALLLAGDIRLQEHFILQPQEIDGDVIWVKLLPKNDQENSFKYTLIGLEQGELSGMELSDNFGQLTRIYFSKVKTGLNLDAELFEFKAPEGVDIFEE